MKGKYRIIKTDSKTGAIISKTPYYKNIIVDGTNTGFNLFLKRLYGTNTYSLNITHIGIGSGTTTPTLADTTLETEVARSVIATKSLSATEVTFRFFFPDIDLPDGNYNEVGLFIDGTATLDSGQMFTHSLLDSTYSKADGEDTTIEYVVSKN